MWSDFQEKALLEKMPYDVRLVFKQQFIVFTCNILTKGRTANGYPKMAVIPYVQFTHSSLSIKLLFAKSYTGFLRYKIQRTELPTFCSLG